MRRFLNIGKAGALVASVLVLAGCAETSVSSSANAAEPVESVEQINAAETEAFLDETNQITEITRVEPAPGAGSEIGLPATLNASRNLLEIIKLAQAGVEESVILNFIRNASGTFNLNSDLIVYLTDLGVSGEIITAMMEHDRSLGAAMAQMGSVPPATEETETNVYVPSELPEEQAGAPVVDYGAEQPVTVDYFYNSLAPYGTWVYVSGYGRVWQPSVVVLNPHWKPYHDRGRWVYTSSGWYWFSDYSWGATAFHYGRWFRHAKFGWCWYPDTVWSPAWVTWRYSSSYCGWAPLPPRATFHHRDFHHHRHSDFGLVADHFTFVPVNRFCDRRPGHFALPRHHASRAFRDTQSANHFVRVNDTVVNSGIPSQQIAVANNVPLRPIPVREEFRRGHGQRDRLERRGSDVVLVRPSTGTRASAWQSSDGRPDTRFGRPAHQSAPQSSPVFPSQRNNTPVAAPPQTGNTPATAPPQPGSTPVTAPASVQTITRPYHPNQNSAVSSRLPAPDVNRSPRTENARSPSTRPQLPRTESDGISQPGNRGENRFRSQQIPAVRPATPLQSENSPATSPSRGNSQRPVIIHGQSGNARSGDEGTWQNRFRSENRPAVRSTPQTSPPPRIEQPAPVTAPPSAPVVTPQNRFREQPAVQFRPGNAAPREARPEVRMPARPHVENFSAPAPVQVRPNAPAQINSGNPNRGTVIQNPAPGNQRQQQAPQRGNPRRDRDRG